jgi:hypothetical protein
VLVAQDGSEEDEHRELARFSSIDDAVRFSKKLIDLFLRTHRERGATGNNLYRQFLSFAPELHVDASLGQPVFHGWEYAKKECFRPTLKA